MQPLILYSTITRLAYTLGQRHFKGLHYVWCAPALRQDSFVSSNPPSSDPLTIYWSLSKEISGNDGHGDKIAANRRGLLHGANQKMKQGIIDEREFFLIEGVVNKAVLNDFKPLFLVMPYFAVKDIVKSASVAEVANATSQEYIIEELPRDRFDILDLDN